MAAVLPCYYLDEPLQEQELLFVEQVLLGPWAKFRTGASSLLQKRVPLVLPTPQPGGVYAKDRMHRAELVRPHLRRVGIRGDNGRQVVWVMPRDIEWDGVFQFAIREETGLAPFVVQRWFEEKGVLVRKEVRVVDTQMLIEGL